MKVNITTLGCKVNQADSTEVAQMFASKGYEIVGAREKADIYIVNTCAVTAKAELQCRQILRKLRRENPTARIIVTGCYANVAGEELKKVDSKLENGSPSTGLGAGWNGADVGRASNRTRPQIKIQDGCDSYCSYCIVPYARGRSRSLSSDKIIDRVKKYAAMQVKEVVLVGIHLGFYGADLEPKTDLCRLLAELVSLKDVSEGDMRFRLGSVDPDEWDAGLIKLVSNNRHICRHFHIPLQSGCDEILKMMGRRYSTADYKNKIMAIRQACPNASLGADLIVGFPGETDAQFEETRKFVEGLPITYLHVFPYSRRPRTKAAKLDDNVSAREKSRRVKVIRDISQKKREYFYKSQMNKACDVVIEKRHDGKTGMLKGLSSNYIPILLDDCDEMMEKRVDVKITDVQGERVTGIVL